MGNQNRDNIKCLTQEECKKVIAQKCLRGNKKACEIIVRGIKHERGL